MLYSPPHQARRARSSVPCRSRSFFSAFGRHHGCLERCTECNKTLHVPDPARYFCAGTADAAGAMHPLIPGRKLKVEDGRAGLSSGICTACDWVEMTIFGSTTKLQRVTV